MLGLCGYVYTIFVFASKHVSTYSVLKGGVWYTLYASLYIKGTYSGHSDYVHCVCMRNGSSQFVSGSEDGTVRIWGEAIWVWFMIGMNSVEP